jgi:hypothetical protein
MNATLKTVILVAAALAATTSSATAGWPAGLGAAYARRYVGPQIRFGSPWAYSALLAANRSVPPQVKNGFNRGHDRGSGVVWNQDLYIARSMPPEVRNSINRQNGFGGGYGHAPPRQPQGQQAPVVIYVLPPSPANAGAAQPTVPSAGTPPPGAIPAPPPPSELPRIIRPKGR